MGDDSARASASTLLRTPHLFNCDEECARSNKRTSSGRQQLTLCLQRDAHRRVVNIAGTDMKIADIYRIQASLRHLSNAAFSASFGARKSSRCFACRLLIVGTRETIYGKITKEERKILLKLQHYT
eukprot:IDg9092t1